MICSIAQKCLSSVLITKAFLRGDIFHNNSTLSKPEIVHSSKIAVVPFIKNYTIKLSTLWILLIFYRVLHALIFWHVFVHNSVAFYHLSPTPPPQLRYRSLLSSQRKSLMPLLYGTSSLHFANPWQPLFSIFIILLSTEWCINGIIQYITFEIGCFFFFIWYNTLKIHLNCHAYHSLLLFIAD